MRHVLVMTSTGAIGLVAIFVADLMDVLFLSMLGDTEIVAAVGYAGPIMFLTVSAAIGLSIATVSLVAPAIGAGDHERARAISGSAHVLAFFIAAIVSIGLLPFLGALLGAMGAKGRAAELAARYLFIALPSLPPLAWAMVGSAVLRSVGDAQRAMHVTLVAAIVTVVLDPILILWLGLGIDGAAISTGLVRVTIMIVAFHAVSRVHGLFEWPGLDALRRDLRPLLAVAMPAIATNAATPIANAIVTAAFAPFGDAAVAGWAVIGRVQPVAFGFVFSMSGSVGPIIGQNLGAGQFVRMRETLSASFKVVALYTLCAWLALALLSEFLISIFKLTGEGAGILRLYCVWLAPIFGFQGALFVANAVFNTLGRPHIGTLVNWARAILGTLPFTWIGGTVGGAAGVLTGQLAGGFVFGALGVWLAYRLTDRVAGVVRAQAKDGGLVREWLGTPY